MKTPYIYIVLSGADFPSVQYEKSKKEVKKEQYVPATANEEAQAFSNFL